MPPLKTKTVRLREDQINRLALDFNNRTIQRDKCGTLFRTLLDIFWTSNSPAVDIYQLRKKMKE